MLVQKSLLSLLSAPLGVHVQKLLLAFVLIIIAVLVAKLVQLIVEKLLVILNVDTLSEKSGLAQVLKKAELPVSISKLIGDLSFWACTLILGMTIAIALNMTKAYDIVKMVSYYISYNIVSALFVLILSVILGSLLSGVILFIGGMVFLPGYKLLARLAQGIAVVFGIVMGLEKLGITASVFLSRPDIILGFFALSGAIAFGLGCKDIAASFLVNFMRDR